VGADEAVAVPVAIVDLDTNVVSVVERRLWDCGGIVVELWYCV
jgi:hypothetical protein